MTIMDKFLSASKNYLTNLGNRRTKVVLGNPTCDLDSAVSALVQGYLEYSVSEENELVVVPVLNVTRDEFRLKTEVAHYLKRCSVPRDLLTFRNEIDLAGLQEAGKLDLVLVDHHVLASEDAGLADAVREVIDHRPQDPGWTWPGRCVTLAIVGSCASLVARNVLERRSDLLPDVCQLLQGPILIDTSNFSKDADRATELDREMMAELEKACGSGGGATQADRDALYREILEAKTDIGELTPGDLLIKDLKVVNGLPLAGFPILVKEFLELDGVAEALEAFCAGRKCQTALLLGMELKDDNIKKDIAVYSLGDDRLANQLIEALLTASSPCLQLTEVKRSACGAGKFVLYKQVNVRPSRKQILPIIQSASSA